MASHFYTPNGKSPVSADAEAGRAVLGGKVVELGHQPFNRDCIVSAFGRHARVRDGQALAGTGALVFEGEVLDLPAWN